MTIFGMSQNFRSLREYHIEKEHEKDQYCKTKEDQIDRDRC
jgi:hypothetical protein